MADENVSVPIRLERMDGKLDVILLRVTQIEPRVKTLEEWRREVDADRARQSGASSLVKSWLPVLVAVAALIVSVAKI